MRRFIFTSGLMLLASPAFATSSVSVPEMDVGAGFAAMVLLAGAVAIIRERRRRK